MWVGHHDQDKITVPRAVRGKLRSEAWGATREGFTGEVRDQENQAKAQGLARYLGHVAASRQEKDLGRMLYIQSRQFPIPGITGTGEALGPTPQSHSREGVSTRHQPAVSAHIRTWPSSLYNTGSNGRFQS